MTFSDYQQIKAVNWSTLKELQRSPLHYRHRLQTPRADSPAMAFGRAVHCAVLEADRFPEQFVLWDGGRRAGGDWNEFAAVNASRTILKADDYRRCLAVRDAVRGHRAAHRLLRKGKAEQTVTWSDPQTRIRCKARLDWIGPEAAVDLKTTRDIEQEAFGRVVHNLGYLGQLGFYDNGLRANGIRVPWAVIAVEANEPHDVAVYVVDDETLDYGRDTAWELLHKLKRTRGRKAQGQYPVPVPLMLPRWAIPYSDEIEVLDV